MPSAWIRTAPELAAFLSSLQGASAIALDTEADSLHHHREKVCLVQLAAGPDRARLVDPLALRDLAPLAPLMADAAVVKVLHGADYDVTTLKRDFGFAFASLFDTMIAARFLGLPQVGLQAVLLSELGVVLGKESRLDDWSRRPLTTAQEAYALDDVRHLLALHAALVEKLRAAGRLAWVEEECAAVAALPAARRERDPEAWLRIKGASRLPPRALAVLRAVAGWREEIAEATDIPAFKILSAETMLALAGAPPRAAEDLRGRRGPWTRWPERLPALLRGVAQALALPESALPRPSRAPRPVVTEATRKRADALKAWRQDKARALGLDVSLVLPNRLLEKAAEQWPRAPAELEAIEGFRRWRRDAFGEEVVDRLRAS
ncbi:MAG TPA: HRDC domain-containing protein [Vicinamibacteria bacterium]